MSYTIKIAILTTSRSDFGLLKRVIRHASSRFDVDLLVSGSHFLESRGETVREIEQEFSQTPNINIVCFNAMDASETSLSQVSTVAKTQLIASSWFDNNRCDLLLFLGDRWELWGVTLAAFLCGIPLAHISGGEVTEGVIDENVRHAHTKMAGLHFVATEEFARNVSLMGEEDWRITVSGECGLDLVHDAEMASCSEVQQRFGIDLDCETVLVTFHPSTLDYQTSVQDQIDAVLSALDFYSEKQIIFTAPGMELGSDIVISSIRRFLANHNNAILIDHFGSRYYLSVMSRAKVVIGNSSSGIVEAPSLGIPSINIGNRQKNRLSGDSVQHVPYNVNDIHAAISHACSSGFQQFARKCYNPYDPYKDGKNSIRIVRALELALSTCSRKQLRVKKFNNEVHSEYWNTLLKKD